jgi:hypothetical protein
MKVILNSLFVLLSISLFISCKDSLGYDPNVQVTEIVKDTVLRPPDDNAPTSFVVDSVKASFKESFKVENRFFDIPWLDLTISRKIIMDTSNSDKLIFIDWKVESRNIDDDFRGMRRIDRVVGFEMNFTGILQTRKFILDDNRDKGNWFKLRIKKFQNQAVNEYTQNSVNAELSILDIDKVRGVIRLVLVVEIPRNSPIQSKRFSGIIDLFFKK